MCFKVSILNEDDLPNFDSELSDPDDISENVKLNNQPPSITYGLNNTAIENNIKNSSEYYKTIQLCEKAYLEYYEKESNSPSKNNTSNNDVQPSHSNASFQPKAKTSKQQLSKSLSENESFNLAIQNISMSESANATNEIKNREIKRRTTIVNCCRPNNSLQDQTCSIWSFTPYNDQFKRDYTLQQSTTLQNFPSFDGGLRKSISYDNLFALTPSALSHLLENDSRYNLCMWYTSKFNDSLVKFWKLWELWKQCKQDVLNQTADLQKDDESKTSAEDVCNQISFKNTYLKDSYKLIFNKCRDQLAQSVKDVYESSQAEIAIPSTSHDQPYSQKKIECILSVLHLSIDYFKGVGPIKSSSLTNDYEYYIRILFREKSSGYLPVDDFVYYIRELFRESPSTYNCPNLNRAIKMKESLGLPDFLFTNDPPQCFCNSCCLPEMITDIPNGSKMQFILNSYLERLTISFFSGWVRFFLNKSGRSPSKAKRKLRYWLINIGDIQKLFRVSPEPGLPEGEAFIIPCDKLKPPDMIENHHMRLIMFFF